ncbi:MAG: hypothetical protein KDK37_02410 [Leptospiraceae bacterium]|nr:hypothetical protein [Leptospiraceae bacterium]
MELSQDQLTEIDKITRYIKQMEGIVRTSPNADQVARVKRELSKYREKLKVLWPAFDPSQGHVDDLRAEVGLDGAPAKRAAAGADSGGHDILDKFPVNKASPNCSDQDVNFLATILHVIQKEYWPAISEQHTRMDFSLNQERDTVRHHLDTALRNLKILTETIEEYAQAEKQDFREQLLKMKNKQTRVFLFETNDVLRLMREFLKKVAADVQQNGSGVLNKNEQVQFNSKFEDATLLEGYMIRDVVLEFLELLNQTIQQLRLPQMKPPGN